jgi:hypothetical protein
MKTKKQRIVRVAVGNNFMCTQREFSQIEKTFEKMRSPYHSKFFLNSNVRTFIRNPRAIDMLNRHNYPIVITINPDITVNFDYLKVIEKIRKDLIAFIRVKYIPGDDSIIELYNIVQLMGLHAVFTIQRFKSWGVAEKFIKPEYRHMYANKKTGFLRLQHEFYPYNIGKICGGKGGGCLKCGLCNTFTYRETVETPIYSLNLSSSGPCPFNCPDCFAKNDQRRANSKIFCDKIKKNAKQNGTLKIYTAQ